MEIEIEVVTHAYAVKLPQYARFLAVQLESLRAAPAYVSETVCCTEDDLAVLAVLAHYKPLLGPRLRPMYLTPGEVGRRAIGRNHAAAATAAALVWFADADYFWGPGCFPALAGIWQAAAPRPALMWPREVWTQTSEEVGDELLPALAENPVVDTAAFVPTRPRKAIGGIQIIAGDYCRRYGYLNHDRRRQTPVAPGRTMFVTTEDSAIRKHIGTVGTAMEIALPGVYRLRHTRNAYQYPEGRPPRA